HLNAGVGPRLVTLDLIRIAAALRASDRGRRARRADRLRRGRIHVEQLTRALRVEIHARHAIEPVLLFLAGVVAPDKRVAVPDVHDLAALDVTVAGHHRLPARQRPVELVPRWRATRNVDDGDLVHRVRLLGSGVAKVQLVVDHIVALPAMEDELAADALTV